MSENVVAFPSHRIVREHAGIPLIEEAREKSLQKFADSITDDLITNIIEELENCGVDVNTNQFMKDFSLSVDSLRASIYRHFELKHSLHDFIDTNIKIVHRNTGEPVIIEEEITSVPLEEVMEAVDNED